MGVSINPNTGNNRQLKKRLQTLDISYEAVSRYWRGGTSNANNFRKTINAKHFNNEEREEVLGCIDAILTDRADYEQERRERARLRKEGRL